VILPAGGGWPARQAAVATGELAGLADSLAGDLDRLLPDEDVFVPPEKALLTRRGGRCERDGMLLEFDPRAPRRHACPACGAIYDREEDYRWWIMGYQLWLSERAVHAALLARVRGTERHRRLATSILARYADAYGSYPNADNVLGPGRVFFSTYLESIWLLQLCVALSLLEGTGTDAETGNVRDRLVMPSAEVIAQFNEGGSNRQVWNSAALATAGHILGAPELVDRAIHGAGGLLDHLRTGLLPDGSWYEGENYHLFAHRGLWFLVSIAEGAGYSLPDELGTRFESAFTVPLLTALPDLTFPSRRDSQYRVSIQQWRVAESLELGLARRPGDAILASGLHRLYETGPGGDAARWRSTGEAERNVPGVRLTRSDLGWKSLWCALAELPGTTDGELGSVLLPDQGLGIVRRERDRVYVALDYGHAGGGHGHPDRLNLWLVNGGARILEDVGTGSYVDPSLHWYRSSLAHNAPLVDGRRQDSVDGRLLAWAEGDGLSLVNAEAELAEDVRVRRCVVVSDRYAIDVVGWDAARDVTIDLPLHVDAGLSGATWTPGNLTRGELPDDGFGFLRNPEAAGAVPDAAMETVGARGWIHAPANHEWWRFTAPGPPGEPDRPFLMLRCRGAAGRITTLWDWTRTVSAVLVEEEGVRVTHADGIVDTHRPSNSAWRVERSPGSVTVLAGSVRADEPGRTKPETRRPLALNLRVIHDAPRRPGPLMAGEVAGAPGESLRFRLAGESYLRTEQSWREAGAPEAAIAVAATRHELLVEVTVFKDTPAFMPALDRNSLDNEHPDTNSDGFQLQVTPWQAPAAQGSWILVPEPGDEYVRVTRRGNEAMPLAASWRLTSDGYQVLARIGLDALGTFPEGIDLGVIINEKPVGRDRRRGQLVLGATRGGWAWLRGDRHDPAHVIPVRLERD
jgi:hypothetical protein